MAALYVVSAQTGAGKTSLCAALANELKSHGKRVAVFKPLRVDGNSGTDPDADVFQRLLGQSQTRWPLSPTDGDISAEILEEIRAASAKIGEGHDALLVEGPSVLSDRSTLELVDALGAKVLVVERYQSDLNAMDLGRWRGPLGDHLLGFVINGLTRFQRTEATTRLLPFMESAGLPSLGILPEVRTLLAVTVAQLTAHLKGRFLTCEDLADALVEHYMVGGLGLDSGELYFGLRENKAVIVRGDRPDIQMAALETPMSCMVLTGGTEPIEYVLNEAQLEEIPLIVVESDTLSTMAALDSVQKTARFDHPEKLSRLSGLLREHLDTEAIYASLGLAA